MTKLYKIWSNDLGYPEEDAYVRGSKHSWSDTEDVVDDILNEKFYEWESPTGPFEMSVCEIDEKGNKVGNVQEFFVTVDWSPNFYISVKNEN